jgi:hypothetical protein
MIYMKVCDVGIHVYRLTISNNLLNPCYPYHLSFVTVTTCHSSRPPHVIPMKIGIHMDPVSQHGMTEQLMRDEKVAARDDMSI